MELEFNRQEKIVGTFIICVALLLMTTVIGIGRGKDWFKTYIIYYTIFDESYNLQVNASVKLFNADIGKVTKITLTGNKVKVKLAILQEYAGRIRTDSVAIVTSPTIIGSEYIAIHPGRAEASLIEKGGMISSRKKKSISDILNEFQVEKTAKMFVNAIQELSETAHIMRDPEGSFFTALDNFNKTLSHFEKIASDIQSGRGSLGSIIKSKALLKSVSENFDKIGTILDDISKASAKTPETMIRVQDNLATMKKVGDTAFDNIIMIKKMLIRVEESLFTLKTILANLEKGSYDIPDITRSATEGILEVRDGMENIDDVVDSLRKNFLIRSNLPPGPEGKNIDAGLRE